jgi:hypothetical protein
LTIKLASSQVAIFPRNRGFEELEAYLQAIQRDLQEEDRIWGLS